jgi:copper transport protein
MRERRAATWIGVLVAALLAAFAPAWPACAHASLVKAVPADGAVVPLAPPTLTLTFNEPVSPLAIRLIGPDGAPISPVAVVAENATVTITPPPGLRPGTHVLSWRVISADGHPVGGALIFSIGAPSRGPAAGADDIANHNVRAALWTAKVVIYVGLFIGIGGAFFRAWIGDPMAPAAARAGMATIIVAGLFALVMSVGLQGLDALALPLSGLKGKAVWAAGLETSYGSTAIVATCALFAGLFSLAATSPRLARGLSLLGLAGLGVALTLSGHASTAAPWLASRAAVLVHALAVAFWVGALLPLCVAVRASRARGSPAIGALKRFSRAIAPVLVLMLLSGLWLAVAQLGTIEALWTTAYGQVLSAKLVCVALLMGLGAANRYRLVPAFERSSAAAARPLATVIAVELALALVIFGLVALWRFTPPPRALVSDAPIALHLHGDKAMAEIEIARGGDAPARASVLVLDGAFQPLAAKEVTLVLANPAAGIEPLRLHAAPAEENRWAIDGLRIPVAGRWNLEVEILVSDFDKVRLEETVALPRMP